MSHKMLRRKAPNCRCKQPKQRKTPVAYQEFFRKIALQTKMVNDERQKKAKEKFN